MLASVTPVVLSGEIKQLTADGRVSGIDKHPAPGPWRVSVTGLAGDAQADLKNHGGPEKAIHHYPLDHHTAWAAEIGPHDRLGCPGAFGENLSTTGWTEASLCIGDVVRFGEIVLQVSQGRQPCWKLNERFGRKDMAYAVQTTGRTGWYYRVLVTGVAHPGDTLTIVERPQPQWPLARLTRLLYRDTHARDELEAMAGLPELAHGWRRLASRRLETSRTEDWSNRLGHKAPDR